MQLTFTLDTNCIFAVDECRSDAFYVNELVKAHTAKKASVALAAISASEKQKNGGYSEDFSQFKERIQR